MAAWLDPARDAGLRAVAAYFIQLSAWRPGAPAVQHAGTRDVRRRCGKGVGPQPLSDLLLHVRVVGRRDAGAGRLLDGILYADHRRLGRRVRLAARVRDDVPAPDDPVDISADSAAGVAVRHAVWPAGAVPWRLRNRERRGALRPPGRHARRLPADPLRPLTPVAERCFSAPRWTVAYVALGFHRPSTAPVG